MRDGFAKARKEHSKIVHGHFVSHLANMFVVGKIATVEHDVFISVTAADGYYELVTVFVEPMDMSNVSLEIINKGIAEKGKVAIYDIYFDTGMSEIKSEIEGLNWLSFNTTSNILNKYMDVFNNRPGQDLRVCCFGIEQ